MVDAVSAHEVIVDWSLLDRGLALLPEEPGVEVALDDGVYLARRLREALVEVHEGELL